ncbi:MAG TPA: hypothetical protein VKI62_03775 [Bacteroidota bacterium]|nr:hypothetical protein [Bacteroidota bacterium]
MKNILFWSPRILSILFVAFISLFALDVFGEGHGFWQTLIDLLIHLIPTALGVIVVVLSWRRDLIGAVLFGASGLAYLFTNINHPSWILTISCPMLFICILFLFHWRYLRKVRSNT